MWCEHNVTHNGEQSLGIHVNFRVNNAKGSKGSIVAYLIDDNYKYVPDRNNAYKTFEGNVCVSGEWVSTYENSVWDNYPLYIPNSELHAYDGKNKYRFDVWVCSGGKFLQRYYSEEFYIEGHNGYKKPVSETSRTISSSIKKNAGNNTTDYNTSTKTTNSSTTTNTTSNSTTTKTNNTPKSKDYFENEIYYAGNFINGKFFPAEIRMFKLREYKGFNKIVIIDKRGDSRIYYYAKDGDNGIYYSDNKSSNRTEWYISNDLKSITCTSYYLGKVSSISVYYDSYKQAKASAESLKLGNSSYNNSGNSYNSTPSTNTNPDINPFPINKKERRGCSMCEVRGGDGFAGNGRCGRCGGMGTVTVMGKTIVCTSCQVKYESRGNGVCSYCKGTGWRN